MKAGRTSFHGVWMSSGSRALQLSARIRPCRTVEIGGTSVTLSAWWNLGESRFEAVLVFGKPRHVRDLPARPAERR